MEVASHIGLILNIPSIGCAKTKLCGDYDEPGLEKGSSSLLLMKGKEIGTVVRTKSGVKPLFVKQQMSGTFNISAAAQVATAIESSTRPSPISG